jgi:S1-C subfamily serine protease
MTKILTWIETNALKIVFVALIILSVFLTGLVICRIQKEINNLETAFIKAQKDNSIVKKIKPTYDELKSHTVFIIGCSGKTLNDKSLKSPINIEDDGVCWSGTGAIIKVTDTETYVLTNNHVVGKDEKNVILYVENEQQHIQATVVKYHDFVDAAVMKFQGHLKGKTPITGIATPNIQDPVYVVGNPLGVRNVYSEGVVAGVEDASMLLQIPCIYGNSGSGVFDKDGNLVGLIYALETYRGFMGIPEARITHALAVDSIDIKIFLTDLGLYRAE